MECRVFFNKKAISAVLAVVIVVIVILAALGGVYYYLYSSHPRAPQTFKFALESTDATHAVTLDALNHISEYGLRATVESISDPATLTSAGANDQVDMFVFQFPTTMLNAIEKGANLVAIGEESTSFLQDLVVSSNITSFQQLNGTTMAAFSLDGPVLFPLVFQAYGQNYSNYKINLVVIGDSSVKAQALIAGRYVGAFLDPEDAATVFQDVPGKFHILATTASAFPGIGGGIYFANKAWLNSHFQIAVDFIKAVLLSARNQSANLQSWIQSTYSANFTSSNFGVYNSTLHILYAADYFSPNMITFTPSLMNASDNFMAAGGLINSPGNVSQIYNFSVLQAALNAIGTVPEPPGPYQSYTPLAISGPPQQAGSAVVFAAEEALSSSWASREQRP
jgi:ABC-type nitrate/sulfonate/bicarbonate transport system substrate-binding protein